MRKRILVVEDSAMMRKAISKLLTEAGYQVIAEADTGADAVRLYREFQPDIVTMDITMRDTNGLIAAADIKQIDPEARILFLSNLEQERYRQDVARIGGLGLVNKHRPEDILAVLRKYLPRETPIEATSPGVAT